MTETEPELYGSGAFLGDKPVTDPGMAEPTREAKAALASGKSAAQAEEETKMSGQLTEPANRAETWPSAPSTVPTTMRAVRFHEFGEPGVLRIDEIPTPEAGPG